MRRRKLVTKLNLKNISERKNILINSIGIFPFGNIIIVSDDNQ